MGVGGPGERPRNLLLLEELAELLLVFVWLLPW